MTPGDQAAPGTEGTGEDDCPGCGGSGQAQDGSDCQVCEGSGRVVEAIGG